MYIKYWQMEVAGIRANGLEKGGHGLCYVNTFYGNTAMLTHLLMLMSYILTCITYCLGVE